MRRIHIIIVIFFLALSINAGETSSGSFRYYLLTENASDLSDFVRKYAFAHGGYVKYYSYNRIIIRVSDVKAHLFRKKLPQGTYLIDEQMTSQDVGEKLSELKTSLRVKEKMLENFYRLFKQSKFNQTLDVEKEITKLVLQIEKLKGHIAYLTDRVQLSEVQVFINVKRRYKTKEGYKTRWSWIRDLGVPMMLRNWKRDE